MLARPAHSAEVRRQLEARLVAFMPQMRAFATKLTGSPTRAEDAAQAAALNALRHLDLFVEGSNFEAWLTAILRNCFRSEWRKRKREQEWDESFDNSVLFAEGGESDEAARADFDKIVRLLACLPPEQRDAIIAVGYAGLSYEQAAAAVGCAVGTVKSRTNRARGTLAGMMEEVAEVCADYAALAAIARDYPLGHAYYPIARAYGDLYGPLAGADAPPADDVWRQLIQSGALDDVGGDYE